MLEIYLMLDPDDLLLFPVMDNLFSKSDVIDGLIRIENFHEGNVFNGTELSNLGFIYSEGKNTIHLDDIKGSIALINGDQSQIFASEGENFIILNSNSNSLNVSYGKANIIWDVDTNRELKIYQNDAEINILLPEVSLDDNSELTLDDESFFIIDGVNTNIKIMAEELANSHLNFRDYKGYSISLDTENIQFVKSEVSSVIEVLMDPAENKNSIEDTVKDFENLEIINSLSDNEELFQLENENFDDLIENGNNTNNLSTSLDLDVVNEILTSGNLSNNSILIENEDQIDTQFMPNIFDNDLSLTNDFNEKIENIDFKLDEGNDDLIYGNFDDVTAELSLSSVEDKRLELENNLDNFISLDISDYYWDDELSLIQDLIL